MAKNTQLSTATVNAQAQQIINDLASGFLRVYEGSQPANADTPIEGQQLVAEFRFKSPAAPAPLNGVISFTPMAAVNGLAQGQAGFYRCLKLDGTVVMDGSIGKANANMTLSNTLIVQGALITLTGFTHCVEKAAGGY